MASATPASNRPLLPVGKVKRTFYLDQASILALAELQLEELRLTGHKPDLSELVVRGIKTLLEPGR